MTTLEQPTTTLWWPPDATPFDEAQLAAAVFLARYSGRTLDAYRHDVRAFFQWASDNQLLVLNATRPHIELYRAAMEERGLAASTIDRRLSTVVRLLPVRAHRPENRVEPGPVRPSPQGPAKRGSWHGPCRAGHVLVHRRTVRPRPRRAGRALAVASSAGWTAASTARRAGIAFVSYSPLGKGFLTDCISGS